METVVAGLFCDAKCRVFPCGRRIVIICGRRDRSVPCPKLERQSRFVGRRFLSIAARGMVSFHRQFNKSRTRTARPKSGRYVCGSGRIYKKRKLLELHFWEYYLGPKASLLWAVNAGRFFQTAGLFLLGFYMGKKQFFVVSDKNGKFWLNTLICSAVLFAPLYALRELVMGNAAIVQQTLGTVLDMWQKLAFTLVLMASFVLSYQIESFRKTVSNLRFYGKMSLTNYISQSVIGAFVYFPFGLYLAPYCGYTLSLFVGFSIFLLQVKFCKWWLGGHKQGPLERIWHKWTWIGTDK